MKKFFFGLIGLLVVLAAAILILPGLIDWSEYKNDFTRQAKVLTGRAVTIGGDLRLALLPAPALIAGNVGVSNLEGASAPHMARLKSLEVRIALLPLLRGEVQVETVRLIEPVIELEVLADGRRNWDIKPAGAKSKATPPGGSEFMPDVRLENLEIKDGTLVFRDSGAGTVEQFKAINVQISARSLKGPFESSGGLTARGLPLSYDLSVGEVVEGRTVPFSLTLGMAALKARAEVSGAVFNPFEGAKFRGTVKTEGENLAKLIRTFSDTGPLPGYLAQSFALNGPVEASAKEVNAKELSLAFGETKGMVSVRAEMGKVPKIFTRVKAGRINLDKLLEMKPGRDDPELSMTKGTGDQSSKNKIPSSIPASGLPAGVSGTLELAVDTLTYRGGVIHQMKVNGELNGGELTLSQFSAQLPGGSDFAVFGFVSAKKGGLRFEGELEASVSDLRGVMDWLGQAPPPVPADRLRRISMKSKINATADQVQISALDVRFDSTRLQGGVTLALRSRLAFGADLRLDRINLDAYLKELPKNKKKNSSFNPFADLKVLDTFDANYKVQIDNAVYQGLTFKKMTFDGTLHNGSLKIKSAGIDDMDGTKIAANGMLRDLTKTLRMENLHFDMASRDLAGVFQLTGTPSPIDPKKLGPVSAKGTVNGTLQDPVFDVTLQAADISGRVEGVLKGLPLITKVDKLNVDLKSPNLAKFFRLAQTSPPVDPNRLGAVAVKGSVKGSVLTPEVDVTVKAGGGEAGIKGTISI
ncbi:MAG: AsmA family protein, partial [Rhodospirillales bacterium]|nr:AsmA family protein [Rhodospirillales bacterium]